MICKRYGGTFIFVILVVLQHFVENFSVIPFFRVAPQQWFYNKLNYFGGRHFSSVPYVQPPHFHRDLIYKAPFRIIIGPKPNPAVPKYFFEPKKPEYPIPIDCKPKIIDQPPPEIEKEAIFNRIVPDVIEMNKGPQGIPSTIDTVPPFSSSFKHLPAFEPNTRFEKPKKVIEIIEPIVPVVDTRSKPNQIEDEVPNEVVPITYLPQIKAPPKFRVPADSVEVIPEEILPKEKVTFGFLPTFKEPIGFKDRQIEFPRSDTVPDEDQYLVRPNIVPTDTEIRSTNKPLVRFQYKIDIPKTTEKYESPKKIQIQFPKEEDEEVVPTSTQVSSTTYKSLARFRYRGDIPDKSESVKKMIQFPEIEEEMEEVPLTTTKSSVNHRFAPPNGRRLPTIVMNRKRILTPRRKLPVVHGKVVFSPRKPSSTEAPMVLSSITSSTIKPTEKTDTRNEADDANEVIGSGAPSVKFGRKINRSEDEKISSIADILLRTPGNRKSPDVKDSYGNSVSALNSNSSV